MVTEAAADMVTEAAAGLMVIGEAEAEAEAVAVAAGDREDIKLPLPGRGGRIRTGEHLSPIQPVEETEADCLLSGL